MARQRLKRGETRQQGGKFVGIQLHAAGEQCAFGGFIRIKDRALRVRGDVFHGEVSRITAKRGFFQTWAEIQRDGRVGHAGILRRREERSQ